MEKKLTMSGLVEKIVELLDEKKAENIQTFDMRGKDYFVDDVVIATSLNSRHSFSLVENIKPALTGSYLKIDENEDWVVVDIGDMLIHIMSPEYRTLYNIEEFLQEREANNT